MMKIIARKKEIDQLETLYKSDKSEFVIVYGRRRIGKTFLISQLFEKRFTFQYTGSRQESQKTQLQRFASKIQYYSKSVFPPSLSNWDDAFNLLRALLESRPKKERKVIYFDEMPWIDTPKSSFVSALEYFWNSWAAQRSDIMFIACGSATSWMVNKLLRNRGGLYNRITAQIYLRPFCLGECEEFLDSRGCNWDRYTILQCYMALGGVPFYLNLINSKESFAQNIDRLFFSKNAPLRGEFDELFSSLFVQSEKYISVVNALAQRREGLLRAEIVEYTKISGGGLTKILENLERCDFIDTFSKYKSSIRNSVYRISDPYTLFYFKFIHGKNSKEKEFWTKNQNSQSVKSWLGFSFESVCLSHLDQIKFKLGISGISTNSCTWRKIGSDDSQGAQIDLLIERSDRVINVCEIKFSEDKYSVSKDYADNLRNKLSVFRDDTGLKKSFALTMITTYGIIQGKNSGIVQNEVVMDDLFAVV
ncbi:MAG: ATP-binding protein [Bacteroidales bacterium]|nr:ATP-binding protein [Bacteroidales bacterium]